MRQHMRATHECAPRLLYRRQPAGLVHQRPHAPTGFPDLKKIASATPGWCQCNAVGFATEAVAQCARVERVTVASWVCTSSLPGPAHPPPACRRARRTRPRPTREVGGRHRQICRHPLASCPVEPPRAADQAGWEGAAAVGRAAVGRAAGGRPPTPSAVGRFEGTGSSIEATSCRKPSLYCAGHFSIGPFTAARAAATSTSPPALLPTCEHVRQPTAAVGISHRDCSCKPWLTPAKGSL